MEMIRLWNIMKWEIYEIKWTRNGNGRNGIEYNGEKFDEIKKYGMDIIR